MPSLQDVDALAMALPEVERSVSRGNQTWQVRSKTFAWERPFSKADIKRFGADTPPAGPIVAVRVDDLADKEAVLAAGHRGFFTIPHFDGYAAVLIALDAVAKRPLRAAIVDAWLACAPTQLSTGYLAKTSRRR